MKKANEFWKDLKEDNEMAEELKKFLASADPKSAEEKIETIATFAKEQGYEVDEEELALAKAESKASELSISELAAVSGGSDKTVTSCFADYLCILAWNSCNMSDECTSGQEFCNESVSTGDCDRAESAQQPCSGLFWPSCEHVTNM